MALGHVIVRRCGARSPMSDLKMRLAVQSAPCAGVSALQWSELTDIHMLVVHRVLPKAPVWDLSATPKLDPASVMVPPPDVGKFCGCRSERTGASKLRGSRAVPTSDDTVMPMPELTESSGNGTKHKTVVDVVHPAVAQGSDESRLTVEVKSELAKFKPSIVML